MKHIKIKQRTLHNHPLAVLSPGQLRRAVGGGVILHDATGIIMEGATRVETSLSAERDN